MLLYLLHLLIVILLLLYFHLLLLYLHIIQGDQQENKSRMLPHLLFYRNVFLSLIVHICILAIHSRFIDYLHLEISIIKPILPFILR
jgi:hypothetical protein